MKKRVFILFTLWTWSRVFYGLIFHPYQTIREINRHPILVPVALSPLLTLFILFILGRIAELLLEVYGLSRLVLAMSLSITLITLLLWQIYIFYLLLSLISAKRRE